MTPPDEAILEARDLSVVLGAPPSWLRPKASLVRAVDHVSLRVRRGETLGLVGESGCGKTTLARTLLGLQRESEGEIRLHARRVDGLAPRAARRLRKAIQYLHQDAGGSLDPWWSVGRTLAEALVVTRVTGARAQAIDDVLRAVGLDPAIRSRYPHQMSGGQLRRIALARIVATRPEIVILDEPTAGLDLSVQATVLNLLLDVKRTFALTTLFISHDLSVVRLVCDRVLVMREGRIVEEIDAAEMDRAQHPYTRALLAAAPRLQPVV